MNPGGGAGWDDSPLDIQVPDDARELERDVIAYHRELRARRRRSRLRRLAAPLRGGGIMPVLASILAVCLVAGAMLSVATLGPADGSHHVTPTLRPTASASTAVSSTTESSTTESSTARPTPSRSSSARASGTPSPTPRRTGQTATAQP